MGVGKEVEEMDIVKLIRNFFQEEEVDITTKEDVIRLEFEDIPLLKEEELEEFYEFLERNGFELIGHEEEQLFNYPAHKAITFYDMFYNDRYDMRITYTKTWNNKRGKEYIMHEIEIVPK